MGLGLLAAVELGTQLCQTHHELSRATLTTTTSMRHHQAPTTIRELLDMAQQSKAQVDPTLQTLQAACTTLRTTRPTSHRHHHPTATFPLQVHQLHISQAPVLATQRHRQDLVILQCLQAAPTLPLP